MDDDDGLHGQDGDDHAMEGGQGQGDEDEEGVSGLKSVLRFLVLFLGPLEAAYQGGIERGYWWRFQFCC
jgi:hypothetical protein